MFSAWYGIFLFLFCTVLAVLEIQIEGKHGWAEKLPCWRPVVDSFIDKAWMKITGKKLTGYHLAILCLVLLVLHFPFFNGCEWTLSKELQTISGFFLIAVVWDFLWFVLNPHYGIRKFKPEYVWWHKKWIGNVMPVDYPIGIGTALMFSLIAAALKGREIVLDFVMVSAILFGLVFLVVAVKNRFEK